MLPGRHRVTERRPGALDGAPARRTANSNVPSGEAVTRGWVGCGAGLARSTALPWIAPFLLPGRAVCLPLDPGGGGHRGMPPGRQGQATEPTRSARLDQTAGRGRSGAGLVGGRLRLGVGHASTVRPDPSTLGVVGDRGSRHESCLQLGSGCSSWRRSCALATFLVHPEGDREAASSSWPADGVERSLVLGVQQARSAQEGEAAGAGFPFLDDLAGSGLTEGEPCAALGGEDGDQRGEPFAVQMGETPRAPGS